jgi:4-amino-4-deoxy-L-arabinose transferase-like glycosyltransferase
MLGLWRQHLSLLSGVAGSIFATVALTGYWRIGFRSWQVATWLIGLGLMAVALFRLSPKHSRQLGWKDMALSGLLIVIFVPLYTLGSHTFPAQMNTDEVVVMTVARDMLRQPVTDIFGPSQYFGFPTFIFWLFAQLCQLTGDVTLANMRFWHGISGASIGVLAYWLFRELLPRRWALVATIVVAVNHSLFFISRSAMRDNTALLFEEIALLALVYGWRKRNLGWSFVGGLAAGLTFYTYYPSRITFVVWLTFVVVYLLLHVFRGWRQWGQLVVAGVAGLVLGIAPLMLASHLRPANNEYAESQFLWTAEGRQLQQKWVNATDEMSGVKTNIRQGLWAFNQPYADQAYIYPHYGYGFVDKVTGVLLWLGVLTVLLQTAWRRRLHLRDALMLCGFLSIWLSLALVFTKAPNYTRMLVVLPFVGFLVARGISISDDIGRKLKDKWQLLPWGTAVVTLILIVQGNAAIAYDYHNDGKQDNTAFAPTMRLIEEHQKEPGVTWYLAPRHATSYFYWGDASTWRYWIGFFLGPDQKLEVLTPQQLSQKKFDQTLTTSYLLTNREVWDEMEKTWTRLERPPKNVTSDGRLIMVILKGR